MKHIHPHLNLNILRAEKHLAQFLKEKFPDYEPERTTVQQLQSFERLKNLIDIQFDVLELVRPAVIKAEAAKISFILAHARELIGKYYRQL